MNAEPEFLASAYLDGELTDDERRLAESDPAVMAEVEQLRALRADLASPPPPTEAAREAAIAAAMAEFGRTYGRTTHPAAAPTAPARVVPYRPRPAWSGWLSAAAAVLVIGVLGIAVVAGVRDGDDDSATDEPAMDAAAEEPAAEEPADDDAARITEAAPTAGAESDEAADETLMEAAQEPAEEPAEEMADVMADESADAEEPAADEPAMDEPADEPASTPGIEVGDPIEYLEERRPIITDDELSVVGAYLAEQVADRTIGATPEHACPFPNVLDTAEYQDEGTGERWPVYLDVAPETNLVTAIEQESCDVLLEAPLTPEP